MASANGTQDAKGRKSRAIKTRALTKAEKDMLFGELTNNELYYVDNGMQRQAEQLNRLSGMVVRGELRVVVK